MADIIDCLWEVDVERMNKFNLYTYLFSHWTFLCVNKSVNVISQIGNTKRLLFNFTLHHVKQINRFQQEQIQKNNNQSNRIFLKVSLSAM